MLIIEWLKKAFKFVVAILFFTNLILKYFYKTQMEGLVELPNAPGFARITREEKTQIAHVFGENLYAAFFAQGYAHAQTRLWQMQLTRLAVQGRVSEFFGSKLLNVDKFMLAMEFHELAQQSVQYLNDEDKMMIDSYVNGVNDYIQNISLLSANSHSSARLLPPEFIIFGMYGDKLEPFSRADVLAVGRLISFHLSWNWNQDLAREAIRESHPDLADIVEELIPFSTEFLSVLTTSVDEQDLIEWGQYSTLTLQERYSQAKDIIERANAPLDPEIFQWQQSLRAKADLQMSLSLSETVSLDITTLESQVNRMQQDTSKLTKDLAGCKQNDEIEQHKAEIESLKTKMTQQVQNLKKHIAKITSDKDQEIQKLEAKAASQIASQKEHINALEDKMDEKYKQKRELNEAREAEVARIKAEAEAQIEAIRLEAQNQIAQAKLESQRAIAAAQEDTVLAYEQALAAIESKQPKSDSGNLEKAPEEYYVISDTAASNNWVVHGNFTSTGKPILCGDPHLGTKIPAFWQLMELQFEQDGEVIDMIGGSVPGVPGIVIGKNNYLTWSMTAPLNDNSDLYKEKLSENGDSYFVDGEWRKIEKREITIKVKGEEPTTFTLRRTHRGPLIDTDILLANVGQLVGGDIPKLTKRADYSFAWAGNYKNDDIFKYFKTIFFGRRVKDVIATLDEIGKDGYRGVAMNMVMADTENNIGYIMLLPAADRKNKTPFIGCRVLDGTTSEFDWTGLLPLSVNPRSVNPERGYIMTANNRQVPDNVKLDVGATQMSTGRSQRIDEVLRTLVSSGEKITPADMQDLQQDVLDINARNLKPAIIELASRMKSEFSSQDRLDLEHMLIILQDWDHKMTEDSVGATVYSYWQITMFESMFKNYIPEGDSDFSSLVVDGYTFTDFFRRVMLQLKNDMYIPKYNRLCANGFAEYKGDVPCAYNVARALVEVKHYLDRNVSTNQKDWIWRRFHQNEYATTPWSLTPLKFLFHRSVPTAGNGHTPHVSKYSIKDAIKTRLFNAKHAANYKQVISLGTTEDDTNARYSIDTGNNNNIFQGNYFDMNADHLSGNLQSMKTLGSKELAQTKTKTLTIQPRGGSKKSRTPDL